MRLAQLCFTGSRRRRPGARGAASLRRARRPIPPRRAHGDPCLYGSELSLRSEAELARSGGAAFARAVFAAQTGAWTGPVASSQGWHLVFVRERVPARGAEFAAVRDAVRDACIAERQDAALRDGVARLRAAYAAESAA